MKYKSLYRKYRPSNFEDVCGQEFIVKTLKNTIFNSKIGHAYLFCGTRGTGKTTIAKIFAKNVNCLNPINNVPCGKCEICLNTNTDEIPDIIEIDAASNNGVDEIRELKNKIKLVPVQCKYKVYIIDEVHMLSTGAFNALLKTLEEPPSHVIFILATTEAQKLPITIISRCQRFDFKKLSINEIIKRLEYISKEEKIDVSKSALEEIAKMSDGAMRDAIGLLDQVSSFTKEEITIDDVYQVSGSVSSSKITDLVNACINNDINKTLDIIKEIYMNGKDFVKLTEDVLIFFRNVFICKRAPKYFENEDIVIKRNIKDISSKIEISGLELVLKNLEELLREIKFSDSPRILFELFALQFNEFTTSSIKVVEIEDKKEKVIEKNIEDIEKEQKTVEPSNIEVNVVEDKDASQPKINFYLNDDNKKILINNTIALATTKSKKNIEEALSNLDKYLVSKKYKIAATILKDAKVAAASLDHILFTYKYVSMVEDNDKEINKINIFLKEILDSEYKIVAITEEAWKEERPYYIELKKEKGNIELIPEIAKEENENIESKEEENEDIINTFGSELIEMEG